MATNPEFLAFIDTFSPRPTGVGYGEMRNAFMKAYDKESNNSQKERVAKAAAMEIYREVYEGGSKKRNDKNNKKVQKRNNNQKGGVTTTYDCTCTRMDLNLNDPNSKTFKCTCDDKVNLATTRRENLIRSATTPTPKEALEELSKLAIVSRDDNNKYSKLIYDTLNKITTAKKLIEEININRQSFDNDVYKTPFKIVILDKADKTIQFNTTDAKVRDINKKSIHKDLRSAFALGLNKHLGKNDSTVYDAGMIHGGKNKKVNKQDNKQENNKQQEQQRIEYKGGNYLVKLGPRGGKYIMHKGEKVYLTTK